MAQKNLKPDINNVQGRYTMRNTKRKNQMHFMVTDEEKEKIISNSKKLGFETIGEYLRYIGMNTKEIKRNLEELK